MVRHYHIHKYQKLILEKLSKTNTRRFNDLILEGLGSEHMNYHLKKLIELQIVEKVAEHYSLTDQGKDYINSLDDKTKEVEKQPKVAVLLNIIRLNQNNFIEYLLNRRLEHPYLGKVGRITGKVRFGETFEQAAKRELLEETGLKATKLILEKIYRKIRKREDGLVVQDVIFYIFFSSETNGDLITKTPFQENFWVTKAEVYNNPHKYDIYEDLELEERLFPRTLTSPEESVNTAKGY
jgi:ADP-ribose pyrophosphatase YjhB (NUDIX family)